MRQTKPRKVRAIQSKQFETEQKMETKNPDARQWMRANAVT